MATRNVPIPTTAAPDSSRPRGSVSAGSPTGFDTPPNPSIGPGVTAAVTVATDQAATQVRAVQDRNPEVIRPSGNTSASRVMPPSAGT